PPESAVWPKSSAKSCPIISSAAGDDFGGSSEEALSRFGESREVARIPRPGRRRAFKPGAGFAPTIQCVARIPRDRGNFCRKCRGQSALLFACLLTHGVFR